MKQLEVHIMQQSYMLGCPEGQEERLLAAVKQVDDAMCGIRDSGKIRGRERIAVLAALNLAFEIADREAADLAAGAATPTAARVSQPTAGEHLPEEDDHRLQSLVQRLDQALGADGQLL